MVAVHGCEHMARKGVIDTVDEVALRWQKRVYLPDFRGKLFQCI